MRTEFEEQLAHMNRLLNKMGIYIENAITGKHKNTRIL